MPRFAALVLPVLLLACSRSTSTDNPAAAMPLFDFATADAADWYIQNDGVMGGKSEGQHALEDGRLVFTGNTVTRGGGFSSVLTESVPSMEGFEGVELRVRGDGRTYQFAVHDGVRDRGREVWRREDFETSEDWQTVRIPFDELRATAHGEPVDAPVFAKAAPVRAGFYIADGEDGAFRLEVDEVRGY